jgi:hypothetical protein
MNKMLLAVLILALAFLLFGCVRQDSVAAANGDPLVKGFLSEHGSSNLKSVLFSSAEMKDMEKEAIEHCGFELPLKDGYRVSYADFNAEKSVVAWVDKASNGVLCSYLQDLDAGVKVACFGGVFNEDTNKCEGEPVVEYVCGVGSYDSVSGKCLVNPDVNFVCEQGVYDSNFGKCVFHPQIQVSCAQGAYDYRVDKCVFVPQTQIICSKGAYNSADDTCEYNPPVNNVCSIGNYDSATQTCIYDPASTTCSLQEGFACTANQTCDGNLIMASDTNKCCSIACANIQQPICGNGVCESGETITNCATDCGTQVDLNDYQDSPFGLLHSIVDGSYDNALDIGVKWNNPETYFLWEVNQPSDSDLSSGRYYFKNAVSKGGGVLDYDALNRDIALVGIHLQATIESGRERLLRNSYRVSPQYEQPLKNYIKKVVERYDGDTDYGCVVPAPDCYASGDNEYPAQETISAFEQNPIKYWGIGNEQDAKGLPTEGLSDLFRIVSTSIKQADPQAKVLNGGATTNGDNTYFVNWFDQGYLPVFQEMDGNYIDILDIHWYGDAKGGYLYKDETTGEDIINHVRTKLSQAGYNYDIPIWNTEMSSYSGTLNEDDSTTLPYQTEQQQALDYLKRYVYSLSRGVSKVFVAFGLKEGYGESDDDYYDHTGLIYDGQGNDDLGAGVKKLSYYSYKLMTEKLEGSDWNNVQGIYDDSNVYAYKFVNKQTQKSIYVAWWDYWNEPDRNTKNVTLNVGQFSKVKITESVPAFENGLLLQNSAATYPNFFNKGSASVSGGSVTLTLGQSPVYIEETTENLGNYVPHAWQNPPAPTSVCGDNNCNGEETAKTCPQDCNAATAYICPNKICETALGENSANCPADCGGSAAYTCPNKQCETALGENSTNCPDDCSGNTNPYCPDGVCDEKEKAQGSCPQDCS